MPHGFREKNSIIKSIVFLFLVVLFFQPYALAQVISNNGAVMSVTSGAVITTKDLSNGAGTISNNGNITLSGNYTNAGTTNGNGTINLAGNWTNTGTFTPGTGTVNFNGSADQTITKAGGETFFNLNINNSGISPANLLQLSNDVTVSGTLTMTLGSIDAGSNKLLLSNPSIGSLNYTSITGSRVIGKFERGINIAGTYLFPIGTLANYNPLNLITNVIPAAGSIISEFIAGNPGNNGLPKMDGPVEVGDAYTDGYWSLTANNGFSCGDYSISLDGSGFLTTIFNDTRILKRLAGGDWFFDGTHIDAIGTVCYRNNLTGNISASGTQFGLGKSGPKIISQPSDRSVCIGSNVSFSVAATGYLPLTYQWYKAPNILLSDDIKFSGTNLPTLNITNVVPGDAGNYYCKITDGHGRFTLSYAALLTVNLLPAITLDPVSPVCNTSNSFSLPYTVTTDSPITYSIIAGTPAMPGFVAVTDVALPVSPVLVTIPTGIAENTYQFIITVKNANGCVSTTYPFTVEDYENQIAAAGSDQAVCGLPLSAILEGNTPPKGTGTWTIVSGPGNVVFTPNSNTAGATVTADTYGTYLLRWTIVNGTCSRSDDVMVDFNEDPTAISAGTDKGVCGLVTTMSATAHSYLSAPNDHTGSTRAWSQTGGPGTATFTTPGSPTSGVTVDIYGVYTFRWTEINGTCSRSDDVVVDFNEDPTAISAGTDKGVCGLATTMSATAYSYLSAPNDHTGSTRVWSQTGGPGTATFTTPGSPTSGVTIDIYGVYTFRWTETNGTCSRSDDVVVDFNEDPTAISAGTDQALCGVLTSALTGTAHSYQAGSDHTGSTRQWTQVGGVGTITFTDATNPATQISADLYGTYVLRWTETNGTCSRSDDIEIWFEPTPAISASDEIICNKTFTNILPTTLTSPRYGVRYVWNVSDPSGLIIGEMPSVGNGYKIGRAIKQSLNNTGDTPNEIIYTLTPYTIFADSSLHCIGNPIDIHVWVEPTPQATIVTTTPIICNGSTINVTINSPTVTTTSANLSYVVAVTSTDPPHLGGTASTGFTKVKTDLPFTIIGTLTNSSDSPISVTYTVTPKLNGCSDGPPQFITVKVEPTPQATIVTTTPIVCNGSNINVTINSPTVTTTSANLSYVVAVTSTDPPHLGGTASTGFTKLKTDLPFTITGTLTNSSDAPITVTYTVTPKLNGCSDGPPQFSTVKVEPTPQATIVTTTPIVCNGSNINVTINSPTVTTTSANLSYVVAVTSTDPAHLGGTASTGFTKVKTDLPFTIIGTLTNSSDAFITVTYTVTPKLNGCSDGPPQTVIVKVEPTPQATIVTTTPIVCNGSNINVTINSPTVTTTSANLSYVVAVTSTDPPHLGGTASIGFTKLKTDLPFTITGTLTNSSDAPIRVTYTVTPKLNGCSDGPPHFITVKVEPTPQATIVTTTPIVCNGSNIHVTINSPTVTTTSANLSYVMAVTSTDPPHLGGTASTGFTKVKTDLPFTITGTLTNSSDAPITVTYTVTPKLNGCSDGPPQTVIVKVEPTPQATIVTTTPIICNGNNINVTINSPTVTTTSANLSYVMAVTSTDPAHLGGTASTGFTKVKTDLPFIITGTLTNSGDAFITVTYTVTPKLNGCSDGPTKTVIVKVNPTPRVIPVNISSLKPDSSICSGGTTAIKLTTPTVMTSGAIIFDYNVSVTGSGVVVGNTSPGMNLPKNYTIAFPYQNNSDTIQSVYYSITPKVDNAICVPGNIVVSEIKIHASPLQSIVVTKQVTCSTGNGLGALSAVISKGANPYHAVWDGPFEYHQVDLLDISNLQAGRYTVKITDNLGCSRKDSIVLGSKRANANIYAFIIPPGNYNISCIGSTDGMILVSAIGITPPYSYWVVKNNADTIFSGVFSNNLNYTDPSTYAYYNNLGAGIYTLKIRDFNGCENDTVTNPAKIVFKVPPPIVSVFSKSSHSGYNISCKGYNDGWASVQTSGGRGGYTYRWYTLNGNIPGPINTNRIDNLTAGTYFLETKDVLGCPKIDSTVVTEPDGLQLSLSQLSKSADGNFNISCNGGNDGSIAITISGGSGNNIYSWTGPAGFTASTKDLTGLKAGVYNCLVRDQNGCILIPSPSFTLTEPSALVISPPVMSVSTDGAYNINCYGSNTGWINITVSGGSIGTYKYNWSTSDGSGIINGQKDQTLLTAGTYNLVVTDSNKCVITKDITLTSPPVLVTQLSPTNITCKSPGFNNGSISLAVTGGIAPYSYLWSNGKATKDIAGLTPGNYTVTVTDFNGCIKKDSARVDLPPDLTYTKSVSGYNGYGISCNGLANGFIDVNPTTGSAPFVYTWTGPDGFNAATNNISNLIAGQYHLLIVDNNECKASETFDLTEPGKFGFTFTLPSSTAGGFNINCAGESTGSIDIEPVNQVKTVNYLWSDGIFGKTRTNLPAGNYSIIIIDANNCHASSTITLTEPDYMKLIFDISPPFCPDKPDGVIGTDVTGGVKGAGYSYRWSDNSTNSNLVNITEGYYKVTVTDMNGCSIRDSVNVKAINEACLVIPNAISPNGDLINDVWNIGMKELYPSMEVIIFNRWGETIWRSERGYPRPWDGTSNGSSLPIDSYHYIIDLHNGSRPLIGNVTIVR